MTTTTKSLQDKAIDIKGKNYVQVKDRILYLDKEHAGSYSITTAYDHYPERKLWVVKALLTIGEQSFTGLAQEIESDERTSVNHTSALENAETSAVGRACAMAGIGVLDSIASADEMSKAIKRERAELVDSMTMPEFTYSHITGSESGTCKKCGQVSKVEKLRKPSRYGSSHVLNCQCGQKTWLFPGQVMAESIPNPEFGPVETS